METITIPKQEYETMKHQIKTLRKTNFYLRLLDFEQNLIQGKVYSRGDLGF